MRALARVFALAGAATSARSASRGSGAAARRAAASPAAAAALAAGRDARDLPAIAGAELPRLVAGARR